MIYAGLRAYEQLSSRWIIAESISNTRTTIGQINPILGGGVIADFNNDGWQDILYSTGKNGADRFFINNKNETFTDQAEAWGIDFTHFSSVAAVGDYNGVGLSDIFGSCLGLMKNQLLDSITYIEIQVLVLLMKLS